jgi:hypothetical protein
MENIKKQILEFMQTQQFPREAVESLTHALEKIYNSEGKTLFEKLVQDYQKDYRISASAMTDLSKEISKLSGVDEKQCNLIMYMGLADSLKKHYIAKGYPLENYNDTIKELKCKLSECHDCFGVWGMRACPVTNTHFVMTRFGMGVFQFEIIKLGKTVVVDGVELKPDDKVINIHIPALGVPLTAEAREQSYLRAKEFFKGYFEGKDKIPFYCHTWLLFKKHKQMLKPTSNIVSFMDDFSWLEDYDYPDYNETWRIFGRTFTTIEEMPKENSIQKAYAQLIENKETTGGAEGIFLL